MKENIFQIIELFLNDLDLTNGVQAISLVTEGAIEKNWVHFNKEHLVKLSTVNEEKRILMGPVLIPNKMILRAYEEKGKPTEYYYVHFSEDTVRKTAQLFLKNGFQNKVTLQHTSEVDGVTFVESWVKDSQNDKSSDYGFSDVPVGTWFVVCKIDNDDTWNKVKSGEINAFSIEGHFSEMVLNHSIEKKKEEEDIKLLNKIIELVKSADKD